MQPGEKSAQKPVSRSGQKTAPTPVRKPAPQSGQPILIFLAATAVFFVAALIYKAVHHRHAGTPIAVETPAAAGTKQAAAVVAPKPVQAAPVAPKQADLIKAGVQNPVFAVRTMLDELGPALQSAMNGQRIGLGDLDKLEFGAPGTGTNPDFNVFNPRGKIQFSPYNGKWISQDDLDRLTGKRGAGIVYNMRRTVDRHGTPAEVLYAIIPGILPENCGATVGVEEYAVNEPLAIEPDTRDFVDDPADFPVIAAGCVKAPGQPLVWFYAIKLRIKGDAGQWTSHAP